SVIGVGSRPWLQKVAALTVAISLTIATADMFRVAEQQYLLGVMDADDLREAIINNKKINISRVVSDIFIWLAQIQTLIRLFPRHKEKVLIKWIGFAMIILDATFSCLNTFISTRTSHDRRFVHALPALSYLFQLALSMLYAAWVLYYAAIKRRYAFYHKMMWNMSLVALLSIVAILTPVVFFITDISNLSVAGWGDYFRWVGAAAASVIVWEWVERIEALEREEKKDGILGREIFDGDEMLDLMPSEDVIWPGRRHRRGRGGRGGGDEKAYASGVHGRRINFISHRIDRLRHANILHYRPGRERRISGDTLKPTGTVQEAETPASSQGPLLSSGSNNAPPPGPPAPPAPIASPVSRSDSTSAASTVYALRYYPVGRPTPPIVNPHTHHAEVPPQTGAQFSQHQTQSVAHPAIIIDPPSDPEKGISQSVEHASERVNPRPSLFQLANPFKRRRYSPPAEVRCGQVIEPISLGGVTREQPTPQNARWDLRARFGAFAAERVDRIRDGADTRKSAADMPVTIIPAQPRGRTWSPEDTSVAPQHVAPVVVEQRAEPAMGPIAEGPEDSAAASMSSAAPPHQTQPPSPPTFSSPSQRSGVVPSASDLRPLPAGTRIPPPARASATPAPLDLGRVMHTPPPAPSPSVPEDSSTG
ncbi:MAG: hypothetical protein INR71_04990, partial [Terriglobus roseus]|nr:hypothetical protein [Terriglobus roseus]